MKDPLLRQYDKLHENPKRFLGYTSTRYAPDIGELVGLYEAASLLDYGSGKGLQYLVKRIHEAWGILPYCYDPGWRPLSERPTRTFDGVICTDVMEHVAPERVDRTLRDIYSFADRFVFFAISCATSSKTLPDGTPCHITVEGPEFWLEKLYEVATVPTKAVFVKGDERKDAWIEGRP
jgi:hypothetical protein